MNSSEQSVWNFLTAQGLKLTEAKQGDGCDFFDSERIPYEVKTQQTVFTELELRRLRQNLKVYIVRKSGEIDGPFTRNDIKASRAVQYHVAFKRPRRFLLSKRLSLNEAIDLGKRQSSETCEKCGKFIEPIRFGAYSRTGQRLPRLPLCEEHYKEYIRARHRKNQTNSRLRRKDLSKL